MALQEREVVLVPFQHKKRPSIVFILIDENHAWVAMGTGTRRSDYPHVEVPQSSREARTLGTLFYKDTYFYPSNLVAVPVARIERDDRPRRCPPGLYFRLREFFEEHCSEVFSAPGE